MDGYQLTAVIFQSIAAFSWPIAFIVVAAMFKQTLAEMLPNLRGRYKDIEIWIDKAEAEANSLRPPGQQEPTTEETFEQLERFSQVAKISPQAAMLELRALLDDRLRILANFHGLEKGGRPVSMLGAIKGLQTINIIDPGTAALLHDLRAMGNAAAHTTEAFSESDALRYKRLVKQALRLLPTVPEEE